MFLLNRKWQAAEIKSAVAASRISELSVENPHIPGYIPVPCRGNSMHIAATPIQAETAFCHGSLFGPKIFANLLYHQMLQIGGLILTNVKFPHSFALFSTTV